MSLIKPRTLNGFRDYLPAVMMPREGIMETAREVFRSFGYAPIDTPTPGTVGDPNRQGQRRNGPANLSVSRQWWSWTLGCDLT